LRPFGLILIVLLAVVMLPVRVAVRQASSGTPGIIASAELPEAAVYRSRAAGGLLSAETEKALALIGVPAFHAQGVTGAGVKIGIIDEDFYAADRMLGGVLPAGTVAHSFHPEGIGGEETGHGTAVAELVHRVAPGASLYLVNADRPLSDPDTFARAVDFLLSEGVQIITVSLSKGNAGPGDGTGAINDIINRASDAGVLWVIAAGNEGETHWGGRWYDPDGNGVLNFSGTDEANAARFVPRLLVQVELRWDEPWWGACTDFQIRVISALGGGLEAQSSDRQDCSADSHPADTVAFRPQSRGPYYITVHRVAGSAAPKLDLFVRTLLGPISLRYATPAGSIGTPGDNERALTVGALSLDEPTAVESYSSRGPTADGRTKPDIVAPDGLSTVTGQIPETLVDDPFFGTSAATPLVAGAAALIKERYPEWTAQQIKAAILATAVDLGEPGKDNDFGAGRIDLQALAAAR
jgi:subtilisin family serine protease